MPIPKPASNETQKTFLARCMSSDTMIKEFPNIQQRSAVCYSQWRKKELKSLMFKNANIL